MSFNTRIIIQLIISIILAQLISIFTYQFVSKINSKNIYFGILRLNDFEKTSAYKDKTLAPKIGIFTYEVKNIYNVKEELIVQNFMKIKQYRFERRSKYTIF